MKNYFCALHIGDFKTHKKLTNVGIRLVVLKFVPFNLFSPPRENHKMTWLGLSVQNSSTTQNLMADFLVVHALFSFYGHGHS